jgi:CRISPR-associated protein Csb2
VTALTPSLLCVWIRFLDPTFHGRRDGGAPEWPPSPLRLFQALVATASRLETDGVGSTTRAALEWLECLPVPVIVAPVALRTTGRRLSVPNNAMDVVARAWSRGNDSDKGDADPRTHRAMKTVRPLWLKGDTVQFLWRVSNPNDDQRHVERIAGIARNISSLGWGIDLAVGNGSLVADDHVNAPTGQVWSPGAPGAPNGLRVPIQGTLDDLIRRHQAFLRRIGPEGFTAPPPLSRYDAVQYRRVTDPPQRPVALFSLLTPDASAFRAFDPVRKGLTVAGMVRHVASTAAETSGWPKSKISQFVLGHGEARDTPHVPVGPARFAFLPLPSIEARGQGRRVIGSVRRVIISTFAATAESEITWARQMLTGRELIDARTHETAALLSSLPIGDNVTREYTEAASTWSTVTPVVLPGYDDPDHLQRKANLNGTSSAQKAKMLRRLSDRTDGLLRKALVQSGLSEALARHALIEWRSVGFLPGVDRVDRFGVPDHLKRFPRYHVRIEFRDAEGELLDIPGPLCMGGGRFYGLGLFVRMSEVV